MSVVDRAAAPQGIGSARNRVVWTFADQALSSLTNAALALVVANVLTRSEFGAFSLALVTFSFIIGLGRSSIGDPFVVRFTDVDRVARDRAAAQATGAAVGFGIASGLLCAVAAVFVTGHARLALLALALSLPGLMLQETWRHTFFAAARPKAAAVNDLIWAVAQFALLGLLIARGEDSVFLITLAWGGAALLAALIGIAQTGVCPAPSGAIGWFYETRDLNVRMGLDFALNMGAINLAIFVVGGIVGVVGVGALRAAQVLLGPLNLLFAGISAFALPVLSRRSGSGRGLVRLSIEGSLISGAVAGTWVIVLVTIPRSLGVRILGDSWDGARSVLVGSGVVSVAVAFVLGASLGLKALRRADLMLRVTFVQAPMMLGLGALGAWLAGAAGAAAGFACAQVFGLAVCWTVFVRAERVPRDWVT